MNKTQILAILSLLILFAFFNIFLRSDSERSIYSKLILDKKADSVTVKELFPVVILIRYAISQELIRLRLDCQKAVLHIAKEKDSA